MDDRNRQRRRRTTVSVGNVVAATLVAYGTYRVADWAWNTYKKKDKDDDEHQQRSAVYGTSWMSSFLQSSVMGSKTSDSPSLNRWKLRRQRMTRCREEVHQALSGFLPTLRTIVHENTNTASAMQRLKQIREQRNSVPSSDTATEEAECWRHIQTETMTRLLTIAYAHSLLFLVLTTQVNLLGGKLLQEAMMEDQRTSASSVASSRMSGYQSSHKEVLQHTYAYFMETGAHALLDTVRKAVEHVMNEDWNVLDADCQDVSVERFQGALDELRSLIEDGLPLTSPHRKPRTLLRFLLAPEEQTSVQDELARSILNETWDLVESPVFMDAQVDVWNTTFEMMRQVWSSIFTAPWAQILTQLKHTTNSFYDTSSNLDYCSMLEALPTVLELGDVSFN